MHFYRLITISLPFPNLVSVVKILKNREERFPNGLPLIFYCEGRYASGLPLWGPRAAGKEVLAVRMLL